MKLTKAQLKEAARILAGRAGATKSAAKAKSSRENGRKGGRPRKELTEFAADDLRNGTIKDYE